ncbi:oxidoreductase [Corynebacterium sp. 320]|uniref:CE1759 family FMN reductase n=1 Tax=Corynebacterium TaxID=1716 RepID=UPI00125CD0CF|nr:MULTISPECIES: CE1759 family FMN reductase [Corynebacterium]KAB1501323.1 oxidoreductase [Corynebacterium sp. 320]KAB1551492.1 oxidoreductase [Corynebacterium sp. 321]KAB1551680.1 oxidoreductase [Corynebacterium sp. 319]KAB3525688.1 oxidoreductase [Corynebacterium sp. 250]KAB3538670.1 oxidoreductase [Corynebacterium sp. 366]
MKKLVVLNAGLSTPSTTRMLAERISGAVESNVARKGEGIDVAYIDIRSLAMDLATMMSTGIPSEGLRHAHDEVSNADALIAATPVFAASYSGLFKMFVDTLDTDSLNGMPMIIAATAGTARHSLVLDFALRPLFTHLRAVIMSTGVFAATDDFGADSGLDNRVQRAAVELADHIVSTEGAVAGLAPAMDRPQHHSARDTGVHLVRTSGTQVDTNVTDFMTLLRGHDGN